MLKQKGSLYARQVKQCIFGYYNNHVVKVGACVTHGAKARAKTLCSHEVCLQEFLREEYAGRTAQRQLWIGKDAASRGVPSMLKRGEFASRMALS